MSAERPARPPAVRAGRWSAGRAGGSDTLRTATHELPAVDGDWDGGPHPDWALLRRGLAGFVHETTYLPLRVAIHRDWASRRVA